MTHGTRTPSTTGGRSSRSPGRWSRTGGRSAAEQRQPTDPRVLGFLPDTGGWYNFTIGSYLDAGLRWAESTSTHFGPLRATLRVLYNVNDVTDPGAYITVGGRTHRWCDGKPFIFDDTLQHQSCNKTDQPRYCLFLDVVRPSPFPGLLRAVPGGVRRVFAPVNVCFYRQWAFIR